MLPQVTVEGLFKADPVNEGTINERYLSSDAYPPAAFVNASCAASGDDGDDDDDKGYFSPLPQDSCGGAPSQAVAVMSASNDVHLLESGLLDSLSSLALSIDSFHFPLFDFFDVVLQYCDELQCIALLVNSVAT